MANEIKFAVITDPHYYSEKLGNSGKAYNERANSDQKMLALSGAVIRAALEEIKHSDAEFLLIAGDLSNDGEVVSHEEMRSLLYEYKKHFPIFVTTATHDWCCDENPRRYDGDNVLHDVPVLKPSELRDFYKDFGPNDAVSEFFTHQNKSSYVIRFKDKISVFCLDDDQDGTGNSGYSEEHFNWIKEQVNDAVKRGDKIFGMQHHHFQFTEIQKIINSKNSVKHKEEMAKKFADIGLSIMFTGHSHMHSIRKIESECNKHFYEFNVASISGYPAPIVYCTLYENGIKAETEYLKNFIYNHKTYENEYLKNHATFLFDNVLKSAQNNKKTEFITLLVSIGVKEDLAKKLWVFLKPVLKKLNTISVYKTAKIFNFLFLGKAVPKSDAKEMKDILLKDVIFSAFHSILDGSSVKHKKGSPYYNVFTSALSLPLRVVKKLKIKNGNILRILTHIKNTGEEIMTGGEIDANNTFLEF